MPQHKPFFTQIGREQSDKPADVIAALMAHALLRLRNDAKWSTNDLHKCNREPFLLGFGDQQSVNSCPVDFEE